MLSVKYENRWWAESLRQQIMSRPGRGRRNENSGDTPLVFRRHGVLFMDQRRVITLFRNLVLRAGWLLLPAVLAVGVASAIAADDRECYLCHREMVEQDRAKAYIHDPFLRNKCVLCHGGMTKNELAAELAPAGPVSHEKIRWFAESATPALVHYFLIPFKEMNGVVFVDTRDSRAQTRLTKLTLPSLESLQPLPDTGAPPVISAVRVLEVERGLFLSVTIGWQTDKIADATVRYGIDDLSEKASLDGSLLQDHRVTLVGLKANKTYRFVVASTDIAGRRTVAPEASFSTAREMKVAASAGDESVLEVGGKFVVSDEFFRYGENYVLQMSSSRPATMYVGVPLRPLVKKGGRNGQGGSGADADHPALNSDLQTQSLVCKSCHPDSEGQLSHPVNVQPPPGMFLPPEYSTLADGRISCMSCHRAHASDFEFRLLKPRKRELCIGCHQDMV